MTIRHGRSEMPGTKRRWYGFTSHGGERPLETFSEVKSLGPCSEEAEAALTDEVMLSLWYGGLNRIYVQ